MQYLSVVYIRSSTVNVCFKNEYVIINIYIYIHKINVIDVGDDVLSTIYSCASVNEYRLITFQTKVVTIYAQQEAFRFL